MPESTTSLTRVYASFLSKISDYSFLNLSLPDLEATLFRCLKSASTKFYKCRSDLTIIEDIDGQKYFSSVITDFEEEVLVSLMIVEYIKPQVLSSETLKQALSDKDFRIYSQANQIRELNSLYRLFKKESNKLITEYTFLELGKEEDQ